MTASTTQLEADNKAQFLANSDEKVSISSLADMTGFPEDFIKKELLLDDEPVSMNQLRASMLTYLESTVEELQA
jgi:hypothetical protein